MERQSKIILRKPKLLVIILLTEYSAFVTGIRIVAAFVFAQCWIVSCNSRVRYCMTIFNTRLQSKQLLHVLGTKTREIYAKKSARMSVSVSASWNAGFNLHTTHIGSRSCSLNRSRLLL